MTATALEERCHRIKDPILGLADDVARFPGEATPIDSAPLEGMEALLRHKQDRREVDSHPADISRLLQLFRTLVKSRSFAST